MSADNVLTVQTKCRHMVNMNNITAILIEKLAAR